MHVRRPASAIVLLVLALAGLAHAETIRGSGHVVTAERPVAGFDAVDLALPAHLEIIQDGSERLVLTVDDNIAPYVETEVRDGRLEVRGRSGVDLRPGRLPRLVVHVRGLRSIALAGTGDVRVPLLRTQRLRLDIGGSGDVQVGAISARELDARVGGNGRVSVAGDVDRLDVDISGTGSVGAERLRARRATISISGSGHAVAWPQESLEARISGVGDVRYYGDPAVEKHIAGVGSVTRAGDAPG